jgi:hypothetical protein
MNDTKPGTTPVPGAIHAKMQTGVRQRYAMATTPTVGGESDAKGVRNPRG